MTAVGRVHPFLIGASCSILMVHVRLMESLETCRDRLYCGPPSTTSTTSATGRLATWTARGFLDDTIVQGHMVER